MKPVLVFAIIVALSITGVVVMYVRRWRLKEQYSLLWLALSVTIVLLSAFDGLTGWVADRLDVVYAPSVVFFLGLAFVALMLFHYSLEISRLSDENRQLAQQIGLLRNKLDESESEAPSEVAAEPGEGEPPVPHGDTL